MRDFGVGVQGLGSRVEGGVAVGTPLVEVVRLHQENSLLPTRRVSSPNLTPRESLIKRVQM